MRVIVVGGGLVGSTLSAKLSHDGHDVVVIERDLSRIQDLSEGLDVQSIAGNGATPSVLRKAGAETCDLLLASTDSDEVNLVVSLVALSTFHIPRVLARVRDPQHEINFTNLTKGMPGEHVCVNPELASVERILYLLNIPGAVDAVPFLDKHLVVSGFPVRAGTDFDGLSLGHLPLLFPTTPVLVAAIRRGEKWIIPHGNDEIRAGDLVYFAMDPVEMKNVLVLLGNHSEKERRVMIAGATRLGLALAKALERAHVPVTLIEANEALCLEAAQQLNRAVVIHGPPTNRELLDEEGIDHVTEFVAATNDHEVNVVACLLAKRMGHMRTFALVDNPALAGLLGDVGIDVVISPRLVSVGLALQYARRGHVTAVATLIEEHIEVTEVEIEGESRLAHRTIAELGIPRGVVIAAVLRHGKLFLPKGTYPLLPHDRVLFVTTRDTAATLDSFLAR